MFFNVAHIKYYFYGLYCALSFYNLNRLQAIGFLSLFIVGIIATLMANRKTFVCREYYKIHNIGKVFLSLVPFILGITLPLAEPSFVVGNSENALMWFSLAVFSLYVGLVDPPKEIASQWDSIGDVLVRVVILFVAVCCVYSADFPNDSTDIRSIAQGFLWVMCLVAVLIGAYFIGKSIVLLVSQTLPNPVPVQSLADEPKTPNS